MTALAMILTAAMAVPGDGPEKVKGEMERGLDLSGQWEGTWRSKQGEVCRIRIVPKIRFDRLSDGITIVLQSDDFIDEGNGKLSFRGGLGLYRQEKERLFICIGDLKSRPLAIGKESGELVILHHVKSRK
ncbi:MAG TPA: hypothetical protein VH592_20665 [Gemmataceae bacterium]|jgi:hypothetical protein